MQKKELPNLTRKVTVRFTEAEYNDLQGRFRGTTCRKFSAYVRNVLLNKTVVTKVRNQSADDFLPIALQIKNELNAIGNNYNQSVHKLHILSDKKDMQNWLFNHAHMHKTLVNKVREIGITMDKIYQQWSQK